MGIRGLNKLIVTKHKKCVDDVRLKDLKGKKIVIDISIYLYKFKAKNELVINMFRMFSLMIYYGIIPIVVFDGKPTTEKKELLNERIKNKQEAMNEYEILENKLKHDNLTEKEYEMLTKKIKHLKTQTTTMSKEDFRLIKELITALNILYCESEYEADNVCGHLVRTGYAWACLSEDMDMFVHGCSRVIRYIDMNNHTCKLYDTSKMLKSMKLSFIEFKYICILSGSDYNVYTDLNDNEKCSLLDKYFTLHKKYKVIEKRNITYIEWLKENNEIIDEEKFWFAVTVFDKIIEHTIIKKDNEEITEKEIKNKVCNILKNNGFIICN